MIKLGGVLLCFAVLLLFLPSCTVTDSKVEIKSYPLSKGDTDHKIEEDSAVNEDEIKLAAGDVLNIQVWGQGDLDKQIVLDSTGAIYFPFVGKIVVSGMTILQLQEVLTEKLLDYYVAPVVTVSPEKLAGQKYYVLGEVHNPGEYVVTTKVLILGAVAAAGGIGLDADNVIILFRKEDSRVLVMSIPLEYRDVEGNHLPSLMTQVKVGDVLYVPPSAIANVERFMMRISNIIAPILDIERGILLWPALIDAIEGDSTQVIVN